MKSELEKKLNKQIHFQVWILALFFVYIIGIILTISVNVSNSVQVIGAFITFVSTVTIFVLWILGIVNAVKIQKITGNSVLLVVFSVILLWIAGIIVAVIERNKYKKQNYSAINNVNTQNDNENII